MAKKAKEKVTMEGIGKAWHEKHAYYEIERNVGMQEIMDAVCFMEQKGSCDDCNFFHNCHIRNMYKELHGLEAAKSATCDLYEQAEKVG